MANKIYSVKITTLAEAQLQEIASYIMCELKAPKAANRLFIEMESKIASLSQFPHRVSLTEEEPWRAKGVRKMPVKNFLVYFWIDEDKSRVQVIAVIYGKREQKNRLSNTEMG